MYFYRLDKICSLSYSYIKVKFVYRNFMKKIESYYAVHELLYNSVNAKFRKKIKSYYEKYKNYKLKINSYG